MQTNRPSKRVPRTVSDESLIIEYEGKNYVLLGFASDRWKVALAVCDDGTWFQLEDMTDLCHTVVAKCLGERNDALKQRLTSAPWIADDLEKVQPNLLEKK